MTSISRTFDGITVSSKHKLPDRGISELAAHSFGFLLKMNESISIQEFSSRIKEYSVHPKSIAIADQLLQ